MKTHVLPFFCLILWSCGASKQNDNLLDNSTTCPADGICTIVVHQNKKMNVKTDETGSKYYQLEADKNTAVIVYEYKKTTDASLQDAAYSEQIIFEIPNNTTKLELKDNDLQNTKMLYGRHCYCKGQSGYFSVTNGSLNLKKQQNASWHLSLVFKVTQVPQTITTISQTIQ